MDLQLDLAGDVVERQELLNGTRIITFDAASADGRWSANGMMSWNIGLKANTGEGDLTLTRDDGGELFGTLAGGSVTDATPDGGHSFHLEYDVDGGSGEFDGVTGTAALTGEVADDVFRCTLTLR